MLFSFLVLSPSLYLPPHSAITLHHHLHLAFLSTLVWADLPYLSALPRTPLLLPHLPHSLVPHLLYILPSPFLLSAILLHHHPTSLSCSVSQTPCGAEIANFLPGSHWYSDACCASLECTVSQHHWIRCFFVANIIIIIIIFFITLLAFFMINKKSVISCHLRWQTCYKWRGESDSYGVKLQVHLINFLLHNLHTSSEALVDSERFQ